jgi:hypothetical protein
MIPCQWHFKTQCFRLSQYISDDLRGTPFIGTFWQLLCISDHVEGPFPSLVNMAHATMIYINHAMNS